MDLSITEQILWGAGAFIVYTLGAILVYKIKARRKARRNKHNDNFIEWL